MITTIEAVIDESGGVRLLEPAPPGGVRRALVTILDERSAGHPRGSMLSSEAALADDWDRPEEDEAWSHLQSAS